MSRSEQRGQGVDLAPVPGLGGTRIATQHRRPGTEAERLRVGIAAFVAIGLQRGWLNGVQAFELSRLDEAWQEEQWGVDEEAAERAAKLRGEAEMLARWFRGLSV